MARYTDEELDAIKEQTDLAALIQSRGIALTPHGSKDLKGICPFHEDTNPSMIVTPATRLWRCPVCGETGNCYTFLQKHDGLSFRHAVELLKESAGAIPPGTRAQKATVPRLPAPVELSADDRGQLKKVVGYYHQRLLETDAARNYLHKRGLWDEEAVRTFKLGYADRTLGLRLPHKRRRDGEELRSQLERIGIYRKSGHEHFNGCLIVPILSPDGDVQEIYGRKLQKNSHGRPNHLYLPGPHQGLWNPACLEHDTIVLCEAVLDALTLWRCGIRNVTAAYGTQGTTKEMLAQFASNRISKVTIAFDADNAGNLAAGQLAETLASHGIEPYRLRLPLDMDVNAYAQAIAARDGTEAVAPALRDIVAAAQWLDAPAAHSRAPITKALAAKKVATEPAAKEKKPEPALEVIGDYHLLILGSRQWRIGGLAKNHSLDTLRIVLRLRHSEDFHTDSLDLLQDAHRRRFIQRAAEETGLEPELLKRDIGRLLLTLEQFQEDRLRQATEPEDTAPAMTPDEEAEALAFLQAPNLIERINQTFDACGLVGETSNRLAAYLACTSRLLTRPLAVIVQSTSAAGKTTLMEAVLAAFPDEERVKYSAMTGQSLFYLGETDLQHKVLAIVEEEGAEKASYALKLLQSEGELTIASTGKNPQTGRMETQEYQVQGPVMIFLTTTAIDIDEELQNRCLTLTVDESPEQTRRIHALQRQSRTLTGMRLRKQRNKLLTLLRNAQRLLRPVDIVNPFAEQLTFTADRTRTRRDHEKYLTLIDTIALLHQHQRPRQADDEATFIQVTAEDIALANQLAPELLGRSLDELPPQSRRLLDAIRALVRDKCQAEAIEPQVALFSRRELRETLGWSEFQVRTHLGRLETLEYVCRRWGRQGARCSYQLLGDPEQSGPTWHPGLIDVAALEPRESAPTTPTSCGPDPTSCTSEDTSCNFVIAPPRSATPAIPAPCA